MSTLLLHHDVFTEHEPPEGHPERADRMRAVERILSHPHFADLRREEAPMGQREHALLVHPEDYVHAIEQSSPTEGEISLDADTWMNASTLEAAYRAIGAGTRAVDAVMNMEVNNAFCAVRPPGHHAEAARAMGFCVFGSIGISAHYARDAYDLDRVAVVDFDVHHGNGTQDIFWAEEDLFLGSTHQMPLFPGSGAISETGEGNIFNAPLSAGDGGDKFREAMLSRIFPSLDAFQPDLILISAGFDAHERDPLGSLQLKEEDFAWVTLRLMDLAAKHCDGRIVSLLEGGYDLAGLSSSVGVHVKALMHGTGEAAQPVDEDEY